MGVRARTDSLEALNCAREESNEMRDRGRSFSLLLDHMGWRVRDETDAGLSAEYARVNGTVNKANARHGQLVI